MNISSFSNGLRSLAVAATMAVVGAPTVMAETLKIEHSSGVTEVEKNPNTGLVYDFGMLETLANRLAASAQKSTAGENQAFAMATARAAWAIGERLALDDSEQQLLRVAALAHSLGVLPSDDPRATQEQYGLDEGLDDLYLKIGRVFVAGSPGLIDAVRVLARHHSDAADLQDDETSRYARIQLSCCDRRTSVGQELQRKVATSRMPGERLMTAQS